VVRKTLKQVVTEKPFPDYAAWWPMGREFLAFMAEAIGSEWRALPGQTGNLDAVKAYVADYLKLVYHREARTSLVEMFFDKTLELPVQSGEFDALSYAFFRSAFEWIEQQPEAYMQEIEVERRLFTKRVGQQFFSLMQAHLNLALPDQLEAGPSFIRLKQAIQTVGAFLKIQGYLRDHFAFTFAVDLDDKGGRISQSEAEFIEKVNHGQTAYALYEMGYPVILPSAVYLYQTIGEAQHHSSRTIEELFERIGYEARETADFDPSGYPSDRVVELWEIKKVS
jgi:hypothetical protein